MSTSASGSIISSRVVGWDISTAVAAFCVLEPDGRLLCAQHVELHRHDEMFDKYEAFHALAMVGSRVAGQEPYHFVEAPLANFTRGATNKNTLLKLASINAVACYQLSHLPEGGVVEHISPRQALSILGIKVPKERKGEKKQVGLEYVLEREPAFEVQTKRGSTRPKDWVYDRSDAYLIAAAGHRLLCDPTRKSRR